MFITKFIKNKPAHNKIAIKFVNGILSFLKFLKTYSRNESGSVVIIALHKLGDSIFTFSALRNIVNHHKENVFLVCFSETIPIFSLEFNSINFIEFQHNDFLFNNRIAKNRARKALSKLNPSIVYDLTGTITSASLLFNCQAKKIIGINEPYYRHIYTNYSTIRAKPHMTDIYLDAVRSVLPISYSDLDLSNINMEIDREYILIHPFAGVRSKEWGLKKYVELVNILSKEFECVILSPPNYISSDILYELNKGNVKFIETKTTIELMDVIKKCSLFIGNDSGPVHIANLLGKPTFTIYGPTNPDFHKPLKGINNYMIKKILCSPKHYEKMCFTHGGLVGCPSFECMNGLNINDVKKRINEFINSIRNNYGDSKV